MRRVTMFAAVFMAALLMVGCGGGGGGGGGGPKAPVLTWTNPSSGLSVNLPLVYLGGLVYDSARQVLVLVGSFAYGNGWGEMATWEYDFSTKKWSRITTTGGPGVLYGFAMVYDANRQLTVLYGGSDDQGNLHSETWEYDGSTQTWTQWTTTANHPNGVFGCLACFDAANNRMLVFGGEDSGSTYYNDVWAFDGSDWTQVNDGTGTAPGTRQYGAAFTYADFTGAGKQVAVLVGGYDGSNWLNETWEYDVTTDTWAQMTPTTNPTALLANSAAFDAANEVVVMFGGMDDTGAGTNELWEYDGSDWTNVVWSGTNPRARDRALMAYAAGVGVVVFGGSYASNYYFRLTDYFDLHAWDHAGSAFVDYTLPDGYAYPAPRFQCGLAYANGKIYLYGGYGPYGDMDDTWEYDPASDTWTDLGLGPGSNCGWLAEMGMVGFGTTLLIFSGVSQSTLMNAQYTLDLTSPTAWATLTTTSTPQWRQAPAICYDPDGQRVFLFGGYSGSALTDTWTLDTQVTPLDWAQLTPSVTPSGRLWTSMAYYPPRKRVLLFGGFDSGSSSVLSDSWRLDCQVGQEDWALMSLSQKPPARYLHGMATNYDNDGIFLFGGLDSNGQALGDAWSFISDRWLQCTAAQNPDARAGVGISNAGTGNGVMIFGGFSLNQAFGDWWLVNW